MSETLLSHSEVLLFGRKVEDLRIAGKATDADTSATVTAPRRIKGALRGHGKVDGVPVTKGDTVLVRRNGPKENGLYDVGDEDKDWERTLVPEGEVVFVEKGELAYSFWKQVADPATGTQRFDHAGGPGRGLGRNNQLDWQLGEDACFARIYGFSYEGSYYELPCPTLFLVDGPGESATDNLTPGQGARAPFDPSRTGLATADFQFANDVRIWNYDKADYTIRLDVATGMFEQVLLDLVGIDDYMLAGGKVAGGKVAGGKVAGGKVAGGKVAGGKVSGGRVGGSGD